MSNPQPKIRSDIWNVKPNTNQAIWLENTVDEYRLYLKPLVLITYWNWGEISDLPNKDGQHKLESLFIKTKKNPNPKYGFCFDKAIANHPSFRKFPSYLRRAAIADAIGIVSSFVTRWEMWKSYDRTKKTAKPPKLTAFCSAYPDLYKGAQLKWNDKLTGFDTKVWNGSDWVWSGNIPVVSHGKGRAFLSNYVIKSPALIVNRKGIHLSVPFKFTGSYPEEVKRVVGVDLGINNTATASVVEQDGTVISRRFFHLGRDIDRRDRRRMQIKRKAKKTIKIMKAEGQIDPKLPKGFCAGLYRKSSNINKKIAQTVSTELVKFAKEFNADAIIFEDLKNWKAKAGRRRSLTKQRFHNWCKDAIVDLTKDKAQEQRIRVRTINAKYTSKYAYDGTGIVKRSKKTYSQATFTSGKKYDCDLSASYNIAARYWYSVIVGDKFLTRVYQLEEAGISQRTPVTLSSLWDLSRGDSILSENQRVCKS